MFIKQVMARPVPSSSEVEIQFEQRKYDTFFTRKYYMAPMWFMRKAGNNQKKNGIFYHISINPLQNEVSI
ncbi:hypothetical protein QMY64_11905 [Phocaeicola dorei]|nr:hypothetical protein QMY64_11905 [Phocaeicola dorei]